MIVVWRGWGGLAVAFFGLGAVCGGLASSVTSNGSLVMLCFGLGLLAFGIVGWLVGTHLNVVRPTQEIDRHVAAFRQELFNRVQAGAFQVAPGAPAPRSAGEAQQQVGYLVAQERVRAERALRGVHTLFWIPIQYWGIVEVITGAVLLVVALVFVVVG
ncbi:transcriptional accessory protein [Actinomyces ruminicola]|nr:transcriptional accessory protein [Actinomyces ruminicola]